MAYKIIWAPEAVKSFDAIVNYLQQNFTAKEVGSFIKTVNRRLLVLEIFPKSSRKISKSAKRRKVVIHKRTVLFYAIKEKNNEVELLLFRDTRRNNKWLK